MPLSKFTYKVRSDSPSSLFWEEVIGYSNIGTLHWPKVSGFTNPPFKASNLFFSTNTRRLAA